MFTHLHCHSYYSFNAGVIPVTHLPLLAQAMGMNAVALTDTNNLSGVIEFYNAAHACGIKPIIGVELKTRDERAVLIAKNNAGYKAICETTTAVLRGIPQVKPKLTLEHHLEHPASKSDDDETERSLAPFLAELTDDVFILSSTPQLLRALAPWHQHHLYMELIPSEQKQWKFLREIFRDYKLSCVATNNVFLRTKEEHQLHSLLRAIGSNTTLGNTPRYELAHESQYFAQERELQKLMPGVDDTAYLNTQLIAEQCEVTFDTKRNKFAAFPHEDPQGLLHSLTLEGLHRFSKSSSSEYLERVDMELKIITQLGATSYFLAVHDMIEFAKQKNFPFLGRGSGANSLVAYLLGISNVDPIVNNLRFERFLNPERESAPDFDIDFSWRDRYEVIHYMLDKYGRDHAAMLCTVQCYRDRGTVREVGKALGFTDAEINERLSGVNILKYTHEKGHEQTKAIREIGENSKLADVREWTAWAKQIADYPRNLSVHAGGIVIGDLPLANYCPVQDAPIGVPITQIDMFSADDIKLIKLDILSTRGLGTYWDTMNLVEQRTGTRPPVTDPTIAFDDEPTKAIIREGRTKGCFYIESPAMISLLRKLRTDTFENLTAASSVIRPGVSQSGMMQEFIRRHRGLAPSIHVHPLLGELMPDTYGVMVYQEDVLIVAHELAGLSYGEADLFRRAMSGKLRSHERMHQMRDKFVTGCVNRGVEQSVAEEVWRQVSSFAGYSFCKAHSASYAILSFQEAWLKVHHPAEFICSVLNNFGGFYNHQEYIEEAKRSGLTVKLPDINASEHLHIVEGDKTIRLGFVAFKDISHASLESLLANRHKPYASIEDFAKRSGVTYEDGITLIQLGLCDSLCDSRSQAALRFALLSRSPKTSRTSRKKGAPLQISLEIDDTLDCELPVSPPPDNWQIFELEKQYLGYSVTTSPFNFIDYTSGEYLRSSKLPSMMGRTVRIAGYLAAYKITSTRKGERMMMLNITDVDGMIDVVVWPRVFKEFYPVLTSGYLLWVEGKVSESFDVVTLDAVRIGRIDQEKMVVSGKSRAELKAARSVREKSTLQKSNGHPEGVAIMESYARNSAV